jgi:hypothetical protein
MFVSFCRFYRGLMNYDLNDSSAFKVVPRLTKRKTFDMVDVDYYGFSSYGLMINVVTILTLEIH